MCFATTVRHCTYTCRQWQTALVSCLVPLALGHPAPLVHRQTMLGIGLLLIEHKVASAEHRPVASTYWVSMTWQSLAMSSSSFCWCQWTSDFSTWLILSHAPLRHLNVCRKVEQLLSRERNTLMMDPACALCTDGIPSCWCRWLDWRRRTENGCNIVAWWSVFTGILHSQAATSAREASYCEPVRSVRCLYGPVSAKGTSQLITRSARHIVKSCDELIVVIHGIVTSWPCFSQKCNLSPWSVICSIH